MNRLNWIAPLVALCGALALPAVAQTVKVTPLGDAPGGFVKYRLELT